MKQLKLLKLYLPLQVEPPTDSAQSVDIEKKREEIRECSLVVCLGSICGGWGGGGDDKGKR